jgi:hypothetical protein
MPPGFEIVMGRGEVCPGSKGGIWNLWWNVQLSDDPRKWDATIKAANDLQTGLALIDDHRLIRAQMVEFCLVSPLFPESIGILCEEIGEGKMVKPYRLGCEGRSLLESLGYKGNQRWHETEELIDGYPGATIYIDDLVS